MPEMFSNQFLLELAGKIGQYLSQEPWRAKECANGAQCTDPKRPDFGFHVRNTWPRGRVTLDGLTVRHRDGAYDRQWHYHQVEITVDPTRPIKALANDVKRRLLPALEPRYAEICAQRAEFKVRIAKNREALGWMNRLRNTFDPARDEWEERDFPDYASHDKWLDVGHRTFKFHFSEGVIYRIEVDCDKAFACAVLGLHLATLPPLWGYWRQWSVEHNEPKRYWGRERPEGGEIRAASDELAYGEIEWLYKHFVEEHEDLYRMQFKRLGSEHWETFSTVMV